MGSRLIGVGLALVAIALIIVAAITPSWWTGPVAGSAQRSAQIGLLLAKGCTQPGAAGATAGSAAAVAASATANAAPQCRDIAPDLAALDKRFVQVGQVAGGALATVVVLLLLFAAFTWRQTARRGVSLALLATTLVAAGACTTFALIKPAQAAVPLGHGAMLAAVGCSFALVLGIVGMLAPTSSVATSQRITEIAALGHRAPNLAPPGPPAFALPQTTPPTAVPPTMAPPVVHAPQPPTAPHAGQPAYAGASHGASVPVPPYAVPGSPAPSIAGLVPTARAAEPTAPPPFGLPAQIPLGAPPPLPGMLQGTAYETPLLVPPPQRAEPTPTPLRTAAASIPPAQPPNGSIVGTRKPAAPTAPPPFGFVPSAHGAPNSPPLPPSARPPALPEGPAWDSLEVKNRPAISSDAKALAGRANQRDATAEIEADAVSEVTQLPPPPTSPVPPSPAAMATTTISSDDLAIRRELPRHEAEVAPAAPRRNRPDGTPTPRAGRSAAADDTGDALEIRANSKRSDDSAVRSDEFGADRPRRSFGATSRAQRSQPTPTSAPADGTNTDVPSAPNAKASADAAASANAGTPVRVGIITEGEHDDVSPTAAAHAAAAPATSTPIDAGAATARRPSPVVEAALPEAALPEAALPEAALPTVALAPALQSTAQSPNAPHTHAPPASAPPASAPPASAPPASAPRPQRSSRADALSARLLGPQGNRHRGPHASAAPPLNETKPADAALPQRASNDDHQTATTTAATAASATAPAEPRAPQASTHLASPVVAAAQPMSLAREEGNTFEEEPTAANEPLATEANPSATSATPRPVAERGKARAAATILGAAPDGRAIATPPVAEATQDPREQAEPPRTPAAPSQPGHSNPRVAAPAMPPKPGPTATISTPVVPAPALGGIPHFTLPPKKTPQEPQGASSIATPSPFAAPPMAKSMAAHGTASASPVIASPTAAPPTPATTTDSAAVGPAANIASIGPGALRPVAEPPAVVRTTPPAESLAVASTTPQQRADAATEPPPTVNVAKPARAAPVKMTPTQAPPVEPKHTQPTVNALASATATSVAPLLPTQMAAQPAAPNIDHEGHGPTEAATPAIAAPPRAPASPSISPALAATTPPQREPARPTLPPLGKTLGAIGVPKISVPAVIKPARAVAATAHDFATDLQISPGATIPSRGAAAALQQGVNRPERAADAFAANEATNPSGVVASEPIASGSATPVSSTASREPHDSGPIGSEPHDSGPIARQPSAPLGKPSPACPECIAPMSYVDDHQRYFCKACKTYY